MQHLYEAFLGEKNRIYYLTKFEEFDKYGPGLKASWNWPAFLCGGVWALYRKMYGWFFAFWGVAALSSLVEKGGSPGLGAVIFFAPWIAFTIYADSLYRNSVRNKIANAQAYVNDELRLQELLRHKGGVHTWVVWVFGSVLAIGILAAIAIPAYVDHQKHAASKVIPQSELVISPQSGNVPSAPAVAGLTPVTPPPRPSQEQQPTTQNVPTTAQLIDLTAAVAISTKGLSANGEILVEIYNSTSSWEVKNIGITLINSQQHVDVLNGHSTAPAYTENYSADVSVPPKTIMSINMPVKWNYQTGYLVQHRAYGIPVVLKE